MNEVSISAPPVLPSVLGKTFGIRAGAYAIDSILYLVVTFAISFFIGLVLAIVLGLTGQRYAPVPAGTSIECLNLLVGLLQFALYFTIFEWLYGATPGKLMLGMRVVMENGEPCSFGPAFVRSLYLYIDGLLFGIPAYAAMHAPLYQRNGDKSAKTIVVDATSPFILQPRAASGFLLACGIYLALNVAILVVSISLPFLLQ